eukprot:TRINITY_DN9617_c0_g1_i1.p1 TRINITY_DN9617_c0_g1~~TRINITY_DN9617_c0_g1_i1.p1  ORF type:complete len:340 (+),score=70.39 TRINITY_DN9617_c0_g1_i1:103-1122(+)
MDLFAMAGKAPVAAPVKRPTGRNDCGEKQQRQSSRSRSGSASTATTSTVDERSRGLWLPLGACDEVGQRTQPQDFVSQAWHQSLFGGSQGSGESPKSDRFVESLRAAMLEASALPGPTMQSAQQPAAPLLITEEPLFINAMTMAPAGAVGYEEPMHPTAQHFALPPGLVPFMQALGQEDAATAAAAAAAAAAPEDAQQLWRKHDLGLCQPCSYFNFKEDGCRNGDQCNFCHICSTEEAKEQKKLRKKRSRMEKTRAAHATQKQAVAAPVGPLTAAAGMPAYVPEQLGLGGHGVQMPMPAQSCYYPWNFDPSEAALGPRPTEGGIVDPRLSVTYCGGLRA